MKYSIIYILTLTLLFQNVSLFSQPVAVKGSFLSPVDFNLSVSGNFGEIRTDHFHSGIDIRTQGVIGKKIFAAASGYISRIKVEPGGYGRSLYLTHPDGHMTVYGHLDHFTPAIEKYVRERQYEEKKHSLNIFPLPGEFPVSAGEHIAYSGNSGYSFGPHLHFEIRDAATHRTRNVLLYDMGIEDKVPPKFFSLCIYPLGNQSLVDNSENKVIIPVSGENGRYRLTNTNSLSVTGKIGFGIEAYDYINGSSGRCGLYIVELHVDSMMVYSMVMNEFAFNESRYINSLIDFEEKQKSNRNIQKTFIEPNNKLSIYKNTINNGIVDLSDNQIHTVSIVIKDTRLNASRLDFKLQSTTSSLEIKDKETEDRIIPMSCKILNTFALEDVRLEIPAGALYSDLQFMYSKIEMSPGMLSPIHCIHNIYTPMHIQSELLIRPVNLPSGLQDKTILIMQDKEGKWEWAGGEWDNGYVKAGITGFGNYTVSVDTIPPEIKPLNFRGIPDMSDKHSILFKVTDDLSGIMSYEGYIDKNWALFEYDAKNDLVIYTFDPERISREQAHELELYVIDNKQNISSFYTEFYW